MPDLRPAVIALGVGVGISAYTVLWWHWATSVGLGAGILLGGLALITSMSFRDDPSRAEAAWRAGAPDLQDPPAGPAPDPQDPPEG